jgi:1,4-alpha-glucan branching enzyme
MPHNGNLVLVLHTHLPWVMHHGGWPHGTDWLCEAVAECYIPLLNVFNELKDEGCTSKATFDISPVLCEQMEHPDFEKIFVQYCDEKIAGARNDYETFIHSEHERDFAPMAKFWEDWFTRRKDEYLHRYNKSIVRGFRELQDAGILEIMTCGVTHGYSALLGMDKSVRIQFKAAKENYMKHFGREPRGTWIPECAYRPGYDWSTMLATPHHKFPVYRYGVENYVAQQGIEYFVVDEQLTGGGQPVGVISGEGADKRLIFTHSQEYHHFPWNFDRSPMMLYNVTSHGDMQNQKTAVAFTRHQSIAMQVWSGESGYPGDPDYLDFHKKRVPSNHRYWRVTDPKLDMQYKQPYNPDWIMGKIGKQVHHFIYCIEGALGHYKHQLGKEGTMCLPFDTELFGHWWFEGPLFIKALMNGLHNSPYVNAVTASSQIEHIKPHEVMRIPEGSWGEEGTHKVWMNDDTKWTWVALYDDEVLFDVLLQKHPVPTMDATLRRIATQALRELLLVQASDWQFLVTTVAARDYAERRFLFHHSDFKKLTEIAHAYAETGTLSAEDDSYVADVEARNSCFPELRLEWWNDEPLVNAAPAKKKAAAKTATKTVAKAAPKTTAPKEVKEPKATKAAPKAASKATATTATKATAKTTAKKK